MLVQRSLYISKHGTRGLASGLLSKTEKDWLQRTANQLRSEAKARGLSQGGTKAEIARRLVKSEQEAAHFAPASTVSSKTPSTSSQNASRQFTSSARYNRAEEATTKFTPRRPYVLNIQLPEEPEIVEAGPTIPYLPDYFQSHHTQSASPFQEPPSTSIPRVLTVASAATHSGGGPSHALFASADPHLHEILGKDALSGSLPPAPTPKSPGVIADLLEDIGFSGFKFLPTQVQNAVKEPSSTVTEAVKGVKDAVSTIVPEVKTEGSSSSPTGDLKPEEKQGLYALAGIVATGFLFSKILV